MFDILDAEEIPESIENSFNMEHPASLEAKISPCLNKGEAVRAREIGSFTLVATRAAIQAG